MPTFVTGGRQVQSPLTDFGASLAASMDEAKFDRRSDKSFHYLRYEERSSVQLFISYARSGLVRVVVTTAHSRQLVPPSLPTCHDNRRANLVQVLCADLPLRTSCLMETQYYGDFAPQ
jgi:hypothetical protein